MRIWYEVYSRDIIKGYSYLNSFDSYSDAVDFALAFERMHKGVKTEIISCEE